MADAGFVEGGFCYYYRAQSMCKFSKPHPLSVKTMPIFDRFGVKLLALPVDPFSIEIFAKVSHRSSFLNSL